MNGSIPPKKVTSEKLKAKQYGAAALVCVWFAAALTAIRLKWGGVDLGRGGDSLPLGMVAFYVRNVVLLFGAVDLCAAVYHFVVWVKSGRPRLEDDNNGLLSDWKSGERSPVKISLILTVGIIALALVIIIQG